MQKNNTLRGKYVELAASGELVKRIRLAEEILGSCTLCPRKCGVNRLDDEYGFCKIGKSAQIASYGPHFGEESCLVGTKGSGTIFFCGCNLMCRFCQNYSLSQATDPGCMAVTPESLARIMIELQQSGCHNINFVTPTHVVPQILAALTVGVDAGLHIPLVYNCGGYEEITTLKLLDGVVDIYMPDAKFWFADSAKLHAQCEDYPEKMMAAILEMQRQVDDLQIDDRGVGVSGLLVRHLVMPESLKESKEIFRFLAEKVSKNCYLNVMDQYRPCGEYANTTDADVAPFAASLSRSMYDEAVKAARTAGLCRLDEKDLAALMARLLARD